METLTIKEASAFTGLTVHTLRYYERVGLLEPVERNSGGHRRYSRVDLERLGFLACLRATGMPVRHLKAYAALTREGHASVAARKALLEAHRNELQARIAELERSLQVIDNKITRFEQSERKG
jgi:DNA-binding transcriptional MerR regulator